MDYEDKARDVARHFVCVNSFWAECRITTAPTTGMPWHKCVLHLSKRMKKALRRVNAPLRRRDKPPT